MIMAHADPFHIVGPAHVSTSGGLTSGFMLRRVLDAHGGSLPPCVHALFCNTGKERPETLDFIHEIEIRWSVPIVWLEYVSPQWPPGPLRCYRVHSDGGLDLGFYKESDPRNDASFRVVSHATASRSGEPFDALIAHRARLNRQGGHLPNPVSAWCSSELKQRTMRRWMVAQGYDEWSSVVGLRADEQRRVARMNGKKLERGWIELPGPRQRVA
jgi:3'-phosphoadenosine 5'-phosphosulfate sulfotransferase (PAPS reductase)/FAD synthetase